MSYLLPVFFTDYFLPSTMLGERAFWVLLSFTFVAIPFWSFPNLIKYWAKYLFGQRLIWIFRYDCLVCLCYLFFFLFFTSVCLSFVACLSVQHFYVWIRRLFICTNTFYLCLFVYLLSIYFYLRCESTCANNLIAHLLINLERNGKTHE